MSRDFKIFLTLVIISALFMPYSEGIIPIYWIVYATNEGFIMLTIPVLVIIPFLIIIIFKNFLGNSLLTILKVFFLLLYLIILGYYITYFIGTFETISRVKHLESFIGSFVAIVFSISLLVFNLTSYKRELGELENIILAIMTLPIIFYLMFYWGPWGQSFEYGGYLINISFITIYIMALIDIFRNYNIKKKCK